MKKESKISELLEKYWDGETSIEEERYLKGYFASGEVAEAHQPFSSLFSVIRTEQEVEMAPQTRVVSINRPRIMSMAAAILVLICAGVWMLNRESVPEQPVKVADQIEPAMDKQGVQKEEHTAPQPTVVEPESPAIAMAHQHLNAPW